HDLLAVLERGLAADFRVRACAQALGDVAAELQLQLGAAVLDRLRVGVGGDELHPVDAAADHVRHGIAAAATHADHLDDRVRGHFFNQLEMCHDFVLAFFSYVCL